MLFYAITEDAQVWPSWQDISQSSYGSFLLWQLGQVSVLKKYYSLLQFSLIERMSSSWWFEMSSTWWFGISSYLRKRFCMTDWMCQVSQYCNMSKFSLDAPILYSVFIYIGLFAVLDTFKEPLRPGKLFSCGVSSLYLNFCWFHSQFRSRSDVNRLVGMTRRLIGD